MVHVAQSVPLPVELVFLPSFNLKSNDRSSIGAAPGKSKESILAVVVLLMDFLEDQVMFFKEGLCLIYCTASYSALDVFALIHLIS
jgi:hypothetical protein